jgi:hypothetical protein
LQVSGYPLLGAVLEACGCYQKIYWYAFFSPLLHQTISIGDQSLAKALQEFDLLIDYFQN